MKTKTMKVWCCVCRNPVPEARIIRKAVTCTEVCAKVLKNARRQRRDLGKCRYCNAPSTPEERKLFAKWRRETQGMRPGRPARKKTESQIDTGQMVMANELHIT